MEWAAKVNSMGVLTRTIQPTHISVRLLKIHSCYIKGILKKIFFFFWFCFHTYYFLCWNYVQENNKSITSLWISFQKDYMFLYVFLLSDKQCYSKLTDGKGVTTANPWRYRLSWNYPLLLFFTFEIKDNSYKFLSSGLYKNHFNREKYLEGLRGLNFKEIDIMS